MSNGTAIGIEGEVTERIIAHLTNRTKDVVESDLRIPIAHFLSCLLYTSDAADE